MRKSFTRENNNPFGNKLVDLIKRKRKGFRSKLSKTCQLTKNSVNQGKPARFHSALFIILAFFGLFVGSSFSEGNSSKDLRSRNQPLSQGIKGSIPYQIRVLVWNVYKGRRWDTWGRDFINLNHDRDLTLIQEAVIDGRMDSLLQAQNHQNWNFSFSHTVLGKPTGVATGCRCTIDEWDTFVSPIPEPLLKTPKVSQVSWASLPGGEKFLMINIHAINFRGMYAYRRQLEPLFEIVRNHHGPIIFAGDFNVWNRAREEFLMKHLVNEMGLSEVHFSNDQRWLKLDRVFLKGCKVIQAQILDQISSSDHWPFSVEMDCHPGHGL